MLRWSNCGEESMSVPGWREGDAFVMREEERREVKREEELSRVGMRCM